MTILVAALAAGLSLAGCASDGAKGMGNLFANVNLSNPFRRGTEADFQALVRGRCSGLAVGASTVGALLAGDPTFQDQISQLYRGDLSNDEFLNAVLVAHPAADANVPAVGCIVTALQGCLNGRCQPDAPAATGAAATPVNEPAPKVVPVRKPAPAAEPAPAPATDQAARPLPWSG